AGIVFFFQAEDGIRDRNVTGVQTCALPISQQAGKIFIGITYAPADDVRSMRYARASFLLDWNGGPSALTFEPAQEATDPWNTERSEERRVGKECRCRGVRGLGTLSDSRSEA